MTSLVTDLLGARVRLVNGAHFATGRLGWVASAAWNPGANGNGPLMRYGVVLTDGRLLDGLSASDFVVERWRPRGRKRKAKGK